MSYVLKECEEDLTFLDSRLTQEDKTKPQAERSEMSLLEKIKFCSRKRFQACKLHRGYRDLKKQQAQ